MKISEQLNKLFPTNENPEAKKIRNVIVGFAVGVMLLVLILFVIL